MATKLTVLHEIIVAIEGLEVPEKTKRDNDFSSIALGDGVDTVYICFECAGYMPISYILKIGEVLGDDAPLICPVDSYRVRVSYINKLFKL